MLISMEIKMSTVAELKDIFTGMPDDTIVEVPCLGSGGNSLLGRADYSYSAKRGVGVLELIQKDYLGEEG